MKETKKTKLWTRLRQFVSKHRKAVIISSAVFLATCAGGITTYVLFSKKPATAEKPKEVTKVVPIVVPVKYYSPLTGVLVADEAATKQAVTGVMIENSPEARPQSGIKDSGVVFEAIAEGGITRFLVLYQEQKPQLIGPVRSVRPYYIDWAAAFNASIAHVGGSDDALTEIRNGNYRDIDQFFNASTYWRSDDRYAPHNVYTSFNKLDELNTSKGYTTSSFAGFTRIDGKTSAILDATNINITISSNLFNSSYAYNAETNTYARSQAGAPHTDRELGQISPNVVVALRVDELNTGDYKNHEVITTVGSGNATIFQNGTATNVTWTKNSKTEQIKFTDAAGTDVPLIRGQTWIVAVPNNGGDVTWQ